MPHPDELPNVPVPEVRDYRKINAELVRLLDSGHPRITLSGVESQRLLISGIVGQWNATVIVDGLAGPELAAELDAPNLTILAPAAAGGAGRGLIAGRLLIQGDAGDALGYGQRGGTIVVAGASGHRAGLMMAGGTLILLGSIGRLCGERQSGGRIFFASDRPGPHAGRGRRGGWFARLESQNSLESGDLAEFLAATRVLEQELAARDMAP